MPLGHVYIFVKIKTKIATPIVLELRSAGPSQIFSLVLWPLDHEDIRARGQFDYSSHDWVRSLCHIGYIFTSWCQYGFE